MVRMDLAVQRHSGVATGYFSIRSRRRRYLERLICG